MLIISGTAKYTGEEEKFLKGNEHAFTMFCNSDQLDDQLVNIEKFFNDFHWDDIIIEENGIIDNDATLGNDTLKQAFSNALRDNFSIVIQNEPLTILA